MEVTQEEDPKGTVVKFGRNGVATLGYFSHIQSRVRLNHSPESKELIFIAGAAESHLFGSKGDSDVKTLPLHIFGLFACAVLMCKVGLVNFVV